MYLNISPDKIGIDQQFGKELYILLILKLFTITFMNPKNEFMLIRLTNQIIICNTNLGLQSVVNERCVKFAQFHVV